MTCLSCRHSIGTDGALSLLWCQLHGTPAVRRCAEFWYEPGTDEE